MKSNYKTIGDIVERIDIRNTNNSVDLLLGVSINKCFIHSVANTIGTDLSKYKIIHKDDFAVSLMQVSRDSKIPIACLKDYEKAIMSPAYSIFRVKNTQEILPDYLAMWFMRSEFDREAAFIAVGGVRGSMPWKEFCRIKVLVPTYEEQINSVENYKVITDRIALKQQINDNLAATCISLYENYSKAKDTMTVTLGSVAGYVTQRKKFGDLFVKQYLSNENLLKDKKGISGYSVCPDDESVVTFAPGDTLIGNIRPYFKKIHLCEDYGGCNADVLVLRAKDPYFQELLYCALSRDFFFDFVMSGATGTKMPRGNKKHILTYKIDIPNKLLLSEFISFSKSAIATIRQNNREQVELIELQQVLLSQLSDQTVSRTLNYHL